MCIYVFDVPWCRRCRMAGGKVAIGNRAGAAFTRNACAGYPSSHWPNTTAAVARCGRFTASRRSVAVTAWSVVCIADPHAPATTTMSRTTSRTTLTRSNVVAHLDRRQRCRRRARPTEAVGRPAVISRHVGCWSLSSFRQARNWPNVTAPIWQQPRAAVLRGRVSMASAGR